MRGTQQSAAMLIAALLIASRARADDIEGRADALFHQGFAATQRGDYKQAERLFDKSFRLSPRGSTLLNMAVCEIQEDRALDALKHLKDALAYADFASHRQLAQADIDRLYAEKVARIAVDTDEGTEVIVDGKTVAGIAPLKDPIDVLPGAHTLSATLGTRAAHVEVNTTVGDVVHVDMRLPPLAAMVAPAAPAPSSGDASHGNATYGPTEPRAMPTRPPVLSQPVSIEGTALPGFWTARRLAGVSIGVVGLVSTGLAVGFQLGAGSAQSDAQALAPSVTPSGCLGPNPAQACTLLDNARAQQRSDAEASRICFALGGGALLVGAALFLWPTSPEPARTALVPIALPGGGGLQLRGDL